MKKIQCEVCGSTSIKKADDGIFECQNCGVQYSSEDVKKLLVDIEDTVKTDNRKKTENLYQLARRARDINNADDAVKYYEMILIEEPESFEAMLYSASFKARLGTVASIGDDAIRLKDKLKPIIDVIKISMADEKDRVKYIAEVYDTIFQTVNFLYEVSLGEFSEQYERFMNRNLESRNYSRFEKYRSEYMYRVYNCCAVLNEFGDCLENLFAEDDAVMEFANKAWVESLKWNINTYKQCKTSQYAKLFSDIQIKYTQKIKSSNNGENPQNDIVSNVENNVENSDKSNTKSSYLWAVFMIVVFLISLLRACLE